MGERQSALRVLTAHFFRRFFDNDTVQVEGDTVTTVVRAIAVVAAPGLMIAFWLQNQYRYSPPWVAMGDRYFFVMFSFVAMGAVSIFEWEMLFPDRLDFLVLSPLSLRPAQMLAAKAAALAGFLTLFLVGSNLFGGVLLPLVGAGGLLRQVYAHTAAVLFAGVFAALSFLALVGVLLCVLDAARFRMVSPVVQMLSVMALVLLLLQYVRYGDAMQGLLSEPLGWVRWMPTFWFLGLYEHLLHGDAAPVFAREMTRYALRGTAIAAAVVFVTYPVAWARMRRMAIQGGQSRQKQPARWMTAPVHWMVRHPGERAMFHFIGQTIRRNNRYQVYLAMYCGTGLALAVACAVTLRAQGGRVGPALSDKGLHAVLPLLLFWVIAGLRTAFAFPLDLQAGWIFRMTGVKTEECATAARRWVLLCAMGVLGGVLAALRAAGWDARHLLVQAVYGLCLCVLLTDGFFSSQQSVPFNRPRMPGRTSLPLMLTLYIGVFPPFIYGVIFLEMRMERELLKLLLLVIATIAVHAALARLRRGQEETEEEMEGYEGEFQLLGLS